MEHKALTSAKSNGAQLYAAIDMGSNSFHMLVVEVANGNVQIIGKIKQKVRLASGLGKDFNLDEASMARGWDCLATFAERLQDIPRNHVRIVATATLRLAKNADVFLQQAQAILNHDIDVISGEEEARQIYLGVAYTSAHQGKKLVIDIGGASTEVVLGQDYDPQDLVSLNMGCVTFLERYFSDGLLNEHNFNAAINAAKAELQPVVEQFTTNQWQLCLGASGTPQAVTEILVAQQINDSIRLKYLHRLMHECISCGEFDALQIEGLSDSRRQVFHSGLAILIALFETLNIEQMQIAGGALREGLLFGMLEHRQQSDQRQVAILKTIKRFHVDETQAMRVFAIAHQLYQQIELNEQLFDARAVLEAAAMLHEIGLHIDYRHSHLHAAYILNHSKLEGFTRLQQDCIRDLLRNYRQKIEMDSLLGYQQDIRHCLGVLLRVLRLAVILSIRRKDKLLPEMKCYFVEDVITLSFPDGWLKRHPLIDAELSNEKWLQHQAGWLLEIK